MSVAMVIECTHIDAGSHMPCWIGGTNRCTTDATSFLSLEACFCCSLIRAFRKTLASDSSIILLKSLSIFSSNVTLSTELSFNLLPQSTDHMQKEDVSYSADVIDKLARTIT